MPYFTCKRKEKCKILRNMIDCTVTLTVNRYIDCVYVRVCVCVCESVERERESERE